VEQEKDIRRRRRRWGDGGGGDDGRRDGQVHDYPFYLGELVGLQRCEIAIEPLIDLKRERERDEESAGVTLGHLIF